SIKVNGVTDDALRLYLFPHSLTHHATAWFDRSPRNSINTFEQMAKMFLGKYFPPSMVTELRNEITNFRQRPDESLFKAWERYKLSYDRCPYHNMFLVTQIDTFYNGLTLRHRGTINDVAGETFMKRRPEECYDLIENMTAHHNDWDTSAQRTTVGQTQNVYAAGAYQGGNSYQPQGNTVTNPKEDFKGITTRCGTAYQGPTIPTTFSSLPKLVERETEVTKYTMPPTNNESTKEVQPPVVQTKTSMLNSKLVVAPIIKPVVAPVNDKKEKFFQILQDLNFNISFADALILMPKFSPTIKTLLTNKDKLYELARNLLNEHCSMVLLKMFPEKLGDPGKFLIPCDFLGMDECLALSDLGASINLMPLSVWNKLFLPELSPTCMTLELADRLITRLVGVAEGVFVKVGTFHFPADFVVVDFDADPRVPLILRRSFLKTERALIDVFEGELTLRVGKEAITFNLDQTSRYSANYNDMTANRIDVIDMAYEEYSQEVLGFSDVIASGNPSPYYDPIVSTSSLTLTLFEDSDFLLEEVDVFLALEDDPTSPEVDQSYFNSEGDILLLEAFLNDDPSLPPPNQRNYLPQVQKELKICKAKTDKSSINKPPEVELKDLPPHLEYTILEGGDKLPVIIAKDLSNKEKTALIKVLKSHKRAIAWKLSDIKGINQEFCTHKILMKEDFKPASLGKLRTLRTKKGSFTVVENEENELIPTQLVMDGVYALTTGIVLGHKIFKNGIEVVKAKVDVITKLPHPTTVKGIRTFLGHAGFYRRFIQDFSKIARPMTRLLEKDTPFFLSKDKSIVYTDHSALKYLFAKKDSKARLLRWVLLLQEFKFKVINIKGADNLAADHLSRLENPHQNVLDPKEINEAFSLETLNMVSFRGGVFMAKKPLTFSRLATMDPPRDIMARTTPPRRCLTPVFIGPLSTVMPTNWSNLVTLVNVRERFRNEMKCLRIPSKFVKFLTFGASISWGRSRLHEGTNIYSWLSITCQNGSKRKRSPPMTPELFANS
nr:reverse transcriptase domain-containing protein [Tanacetum cinerariifolium]